jgi:hypothetical protein
MGYEKRYVEVKGLSEAMCYISSSSTFSEKLLTYIPFLVKLGQREGRVLLCPQAFACG